MPHRYPKPAFYILLVLIPLLVISIWAWDYIQDIFGLLSDRAGIRSYVNGLGLWGPLLIALVQLLQIIIPTIPGQPVNIISGYLFGLTGGFLLTLFSSMGASLLAFGLARWAGRPLVDRLIDPRKLEHWDQLGENYGFYFLTAGYLMPAFFPTDVMNYVAGLSSVNTVTFTTANLIGRIPNVLLFTLIGSHGLQISVVQWTAISLVYCLLFVPLHLLHKRQTNK